MNLKKLYVDGLLGETLREFRKGRKYIGGHEDESDEIIGKDKRYIHGRGFGPIPPHLSETARVEARKHVC